jgi:hypothetical protein
MVGLMFERIVIAMFLAYCTTPAAMMAWAMVSRLAGCSPLKILKTDVRLMPVCLAISEGQTPALRSSRTLSALALAVGALPLYLPSALALAMPTSILSRVSFLSN